MFFYQLVTMNPNLDMKPVKLKGTITVSQLATYLGWSSNSIEGLVRADRLPSLEIDGQLRFRLNDVLDWIEVNMPSLDSARVTQLETKMESSLLADGVFRTLRTDRLASRMPLAGIALDVPLIEKSEVLRSLTHLASDTGLLFDKTQLLEALLDRESLCSTAMPGGVALCHPRRPIPDIIERQFLCFLRTSTPVDFGGEDGAGTSMFFLLCTPDDRSHLHGLARLARILRGGTLDLLKTAATSEDILSILAAAEARIQTKP